MSSDSDDSAVMVEHEHTTKSAAAAAAAPSTAAAAAADNDAEEPSLVDETATTPTEEAAAPQGPAAYNIVSIGSKEDAYAFSFHEDKLQEILGRVPAHSKVAVVSVVGAFRTGKSFLLSWFLRYLHAQQQSQNSSSAVNASSTTAPWYEQLGSLGNDGFHWKAGSDRDTTGIWMWSHPQLLPASDDSPPLAVLLVDTQGMFDNETPMNLTASIFGFSTLLSSYQIYNVDKLIQEDNLQQLALFSEFAKVAVQEEEKKSEKTEGVEVLKQPFQKIEFLVRDWEHFEDDEDDHQETASPERLARMQASMHEYLQKTIAPRNAKDLAETRDQIHSCFDSISCFGLCHPGFAVTKKKFTGTVDQMEPLFLQLLDRLCRRVFTNVETAVQPKQIHGRELTAPQLGAYIRAYAQLFQSGARFPEAATLLEATASANNTNAIHLALAAYQEDMDRVAGPAVSDWWKADELQHEHDRTWRRSLAVFDDMANFGNARAIQEARTSLETQLETKFAVYKSLNDGRNPLAGLETYFIPASIATLAVVLRWFTDMTCSPYSSVCRTTSEALSHTSAVVWCFLLIVAATKFKQIKDFVVKAKAALEAVAAPPAAGQNKAKRD